MLLWQRKAVVLKLREYALRNTAWQTGALGYLERFK
jgi:hypothetical protein